MDCYQPSYLRTSRAKHYLVTGGCGFIGSHLVDELIAAGHSVTVLDDLSTGCEENLNPKASLIVGDTADEQTVLDAFADIDGCFHLAAIASVEKSTKEWRQAHMVNLVSLINVFLAASRADPSVPVVYASSAAVYGNCPVIPTPETAPHRPLTAYGADKYACDLQGKVAWLVHKVPNIGLRPFNVYGPRQNPDSPYSGVVSIFADRMRHGLPVTIYGDGRQVRDFVYVGDAVKGFAAAMKKIEEPQQACSDVVNLCTGQPTSISGLANTIAAITGYSNRYVYEPARRGDIYISIGDPAYLKHRLRLSFETTLEQGLMRMLESDLVHANRQSQMAILSGRS